MATRRKSYTTLFKLDAVEYALKHGTSAAAAHCEVSERLIRRWKADKENLEDMPPRKRANRFGKQKVEEIEEAVYAWVVQRREAKRAVLVKDIRLKAFHLAQESGRQDFKASASWCRRFMKRKDLVVRRRTSVGQPQPEDYEEICRNFRRFVQRESLHISAHNLGNVDEVPVPFDIVHARTVDQAGVDAVKIDSTGHEKSNFTVVLSVTAAGEKLKPMIIFKKKKVPKESFPSGVIIMANDKGWMNQDLMRVWLTEVWNKRQRCSDDPSQSLVIMDSARCHLTENVREFFKKHSKIAIIPAGMTKFLQPLDVGINKPFKDNLRAGWERWMADPAKARFTESGIRKRMSYGEVAALVHESFSAISEDTIRNSVTKALDEESMIDEMNESFDALIVADNDDNDGRSFGRVVAVNVFDDDEHGIEPE